MYASTRGKEQVVNRFTAAGQKPSEHMHQQMSAKEPSYMYVPPLESLLKAVGMTQAEFEDSSSVMIPTELLKLLLQVAIVNSDFNEVGYLRENPDVAEAVRSGKVEDSRLHYVGFGYFEGRDGATPEVDEAWYLRTYTDVAEGVRSGLIESAAEHFRVAGVTEGRSPSLAYCLAAEQWKKVFGQI